MSGTSWTRCPGTRRPAVGVGSVTRDGPTYLRSGYCEVCGILVFVAGTGRPSQHRFTRGDQFGAWMPLPMPFGARSSA